MQGLMRRRGLMAVLFAGLAWAPSCAWADSAISVTDAWARVTASADGAGVVYVTVTNTGTPDVLVAAYTPVAKKAKLHISRMLNGMVEMHAVESLPVSAGKPLIFAPDGYHIMLTGLTQRLTVGEHFPLTLIFTRAGAVSTDVTVEPMSYMPTTASSGMKM